MPKAGLAELVFPSGGLNRRYSYQSQPPFSSPELLNVRPVDTITGRERGGSRPGQAKAFYDLLGSGNPIRMLNGVTLVASDAYTFIEDDFKGTVLGSAWTTATWIGTAPSILTGNFSGITYNTAAGVTHASISNFDTASSYEISLFIAPYGGVHNGTYKIFGRMGSGLAATTDGFVAELTLTGSVGTYSGTLTSYNAGTPTATAFTGGATGQADAGWFRVTVNGNDVSCKWLGNAALAATTCSFGGSAGHRFGFGMTTTVSGGLTLVDTFRLQYKTNDKSQNRRRPLIASANGSLYKENLLGSLTAVSSSLTLASDRELMSAERAQKLYIADNGNPCTTQTDGTTDVAGTLLDSVSVSDWTALGISTNDHVVSISSGVGVTAGTYAISSIHATNGLTLATSAGASASAIVFRVERGPKVYDPTLDTLTALTATTGIVPVGNPLCCRYRDRLVLAGAPVAPHVWYMSRAGTLTDFDYAAASSDQGRAVAGTSSDAGTVGEPILALAPFNDDYLIMGCENSLWMFRGDPAQGGRIDSLSKTAGIVDKSAWCRGPGGEFIFLSRDGLYGLPAGGQGTPQPLSRDTMPRELLDISATNYTAQLRYDARDRGIHIFLTPRLGKTQYHFWYDWRLKSFFPFTLPTNYEPTASLEYVSPSAEDSCVLMGGRDGYVRRFRDAMETDDGTSITNYVWYGPIMLGGNNYNEGLLSELIGATAALSGTVTWDVYVGETHEAAQASSSFASGTWTTAGLDYKDRPRARGASFFLKVSGSGTRRWGLERVTCRIEKRGKQRL